MVFSCICQFEYFDKHYSFQPFISEIAFTILSPVGSVHMDWARCFTKSLVWYRKCGFSATTASLITSAISVGFWDWKRKAMQYKAKLLHIQFFLLRYTRMIRISNGCCDGYYCNMEFSRNSKPHQNSFLAKNIIIWKSTHYVLNIFTKSFKYFHA